MSAEYRPVSDLPFLGIDKRLEKYGIQVEQRGAVTILISPFGRLCVKPEGGSAYFEGDRAVIDVLEREYGIAMVNEDDHRFWGFASLEEMKTEFRRPRSYQTLVVVEGPSIADV